MYAYIDQMLYDFDGHLSIQDILHMTYKELGYLHEHRDMIKKKNGPSLKDLRL